MNSLLPKHELLHARDWQSESLNYKFSPKTVWKHGEFKNQFDWRWELYFEFRVIFLVKRATPVALQDNLFCSAFSAPFFPDSVINKSSLTTAMGLCWTDEKINIPVQISDNLNFWNLK